MTALGEEDPAFDFLLMLFLDAADQLTVLPTHRVVRGLGDGRARRGCATACRALFEVDAGDGRRARRGGSRPRASSPGGEGRFGLVTRDGAWLLTARRDAFAGAAGRGGDAVAGAGRDAARAARSTRSLGIDAAAVAGGERIAYTKSAAEALALVDAGDGRRRRRVPARADARSRRSSRSPATAT